MQIDRTKLIGWMTGATSEVFGTMLGLEIEPGESYFEQAALDTTGGVVAFIGLAGRWVGSGILHCDASLACKLHTHLLMIEDEAGGGAVTEDVLDAVAEIANMIIGNIKNPLEEELGPMGMSIPTVIFGRNFTTRSAATDSWTVFPFQCCGEKAEVKMCLSPAPEVHEVRHGFTPATRVLPQS